MQPSAVLLKNDDATLPLDPATPLVFMAGAGAHDVGLQSGGWTIDGQGQPGAITPGTTIYDGVRPLVSPETRVELDPSGNFAGVTDEAGQPAVADVAIVVLAEPPYAEGPGDRADLGLPPEDLELLAESGHARAARRRAPVGPSAGRHRPARRLGRLRRRLAAGHRGQGVADVLFGQAPFTGRLPYTWPRSNEQLPIDPTAPPSRVATARCSRAASA